MFFTRREVEAGKAKRRAAELAMIGALMDLYKEKVGAAWAEVFARTVRIEVSVKE